ncbi:MAG: hypothetical protein HY290_17615 [Planctomycetia bacterium]|nr:hypothetical protein [Planctomycetia bacterium]
MEIACPVCQLAIDVRRSSFGMRIDCPGCGETFRVPAEQGLVDPAEAWISDAHEPPAAAQTEPVAPPPIPQRTKTCPMCGEQEEPDARRCRACGELLAGFQGADGYSIQGIWRNGSQLVMTKDAMLPAICVQTNQPATERLRRKLYWHHPLIYLLVFLGPIGVLLLIIISLIVRQAADIQIGLSHARIVRRRWVIALGWTGSVLGIGMSFSSGAANYQHASYLLLGGMALLLGSMITGIILARIVTPTRITTRYVWLKGVHPGYLAALPPFPGE